MRLLLIYSSTEGHTAAIAGFIRDELAHLHCTVNVFEAGPAAPGPMGYDGVIVAASIHGGQYAGEVVDYVGQYAAALNQMPGIFYSVGLSITSKDPAALRSLNDTTETFLRKSKWKPDAVEQVAGALLYTKYGFFKKMLIKSIMKKAGGDVDTKRDFVYTDWSGLRASLQGFALRFEVISAR